MDTILTWTLYLALAVHFGLLAYCIYKVWHGENVIDRLVGADVIGTIGLAVLILVGMLQNSTLFLDAAVGLAVLSYIGSIALAKYIADRKGAGEKLK